MAEFGRRLRRLERRISKRTRWTILTVVVLLVGARIAAPFVIEKVINDRLAKLDGYWGHVEDVDLALYRGAYRIEGIRIVKTGEEVPVPFFRAPALDISIEWGALIEGPAIVAELDFHQPEINFVEAGDGSMAQDGGEADWRELVNDIVPITINRLAVHDGEIHYRAFEKDPPVNLYVQNVHATARNLSTLHSEGQALPSTIDVRGLALASGRLEAHARLDPWQEEPTFDLDLEVRRLDVTELNDFLGAYFGVDAEDGDFYLYSEIEAREGRFTGYVKPMVEGLDLFRLGEDGDFFDVLGDAIVGLVTSIFQNHPEGRFATRVPVSGSFEHPDFDTWAAVWAILKNTFIEAIQHGIQGDGWEEEGEEGDDESREERRQRIAEAREQARAEREEAAQQRAERRREEREQAEEREREQREEAEARRREAEERRREQRAQAEERAREQREQAAEARREAREEAQARQRERAERAEAE